MRNDNLKLSPVDNKTKAAFAKVCQDAGLTPREALTLFTESVVEQGDIPFHLKAKQLESCMYGNNASSQIRVPTQDLQKEDMLFADTESRFFNELMGI